MKKYFDKAVPMREREFYILSVIGTLTNIIGLMISIISRASLQGKLVVGFGAIAMLLCTVYGYSTRKVEGMFDVMMIVINLIEFPWMFLLITGLDGGNSYYFFMGLLLIMMFMKNSKRLLFIILTLSVDGIVMAYDYSVRCAGMNRNEKMPYLGRIVAYFIVGLFVVVVAYVSEREQQKQNEIIMELNQELKDLSEQDPLTKCYNRRYLTDYLEQMEEESKQKVFVLMIDVDNFKMINDTYGHSFGDEVLIYMAETLKELMGDKGIAARFGGEEFIAVMETEKVTEMQFFAEGVKEKLVLFSQEKKNIDITFSGGIQRWEENFDMTQLLKKVDSKLYQAKAQGKNKVIC